MDIHFHGCVGYDFCDGSKEAFDAITKYQAKDGGSGLFGPHIKNLQLEKEKLVAELKNVFNEIDNIETDFPTGIKWQGNNKLMFMRRLLPDGSEILAAANIEPIITKTVEDGAILVRDYGTGVFDANNFKEVLISDPDTKYYVYEGINYLTKEKIYIGNILFLTNFNDLHSSSKSKDKYFLYAS